METSRITQAFVMAIKLLLSNFAILNCKCHGEVVFSYLIRGALAHVAWV